MAENRRLIVAFNFDGTLTRKDTFTAFIKFAKGKTAFYRGFIYYSPLLVACKLRLYPNWKIKQKIIRYFFKDMPAEEFAALGHEFTGIINGFVRPEIIAAIKNYKQRGAAMYVISASIENWIEPWCRSIGINQVIATRMETGSDGLLTGYFSTKNCYGQEKVIRFLEKEPDRNTYTLLVYGDSRGDKELIAFANKSWHVGRFGKETVKRTD